MSNSGVSLGDCQVCGNLPAVGVASVPGIPMSLAWCQRCLNTCNGPYGLHLVNLASFLADDDANVDETLKQVRQGVRDGLVADWALDQIVFKDGAYVSMRVALDLVEEGHDGEQGVANSDQAGDQ